MFGISRCFPLVLVAVLCAAYGIAADTPPLLSPDKWKADVAYMAKELPNRHKNAFHHISREQFEQAAKKLEAEAPQLTPNQVVVGMMQLTAIIGDGHTNVHLPGYFRRFPLAVGWFGDELRVVRAQSEYKQALGARVLKIDGTPLASVMERLRTVVSQDESEGFVRVNVAGFIMWAEVLNGLGIMKDPSAAVFTVQADGGAPFDLRVVPGPPSPGVDWISAASSPPLSAQRLTEQFWFAPTRGGAVYVAFRGYKDLGSNARGLLEYIAREKPTKVIVDLRGNGGGDFNQGRKHMVEPLQQYSSSAGARLYVLIGPRTFSAALANAVDFKKVGATLVGEPIGERPNSYQENDEMTLPNSKLIVSYSTRYYQFLEGADLVRPDKNIERTWADFLAGKDAALDWILSQK